MSTKRRRFPGALCGLFAPDPGRWDATGPSPGTAGGGRVVRTCNTCAAWRKHGGNQLETWDFGESYVRLRFDLYVLYTSVYYVYGIFYW